MAREYFEDEAPSIKPKKSREYFEDVSVVEKPETGPVIGASAAEMIPTGGYPKAPKPTVMGWFYKGLVNVMPFLKARQKPHSRWLQRNLQCVRNWAQEFQKQKLKKSV
jgi:hypothetical protein